jgi:exonuclease SbcD
VKFLHTSDWHVGKTLKSRSRLDEQRAVLAEIIHIAVDNQVDAVLVCGDLYDSATPSPEAQKLANGALLKLHDSGIHVVVIAGNHDRAEGFEALRPLMGVAGIEYVGKPQLSSSGGVHRFTARSTGEEVVVAPLPFLSRRYVVRAEEIVTNTPSENAGLYEQSIREILRALAAEFSPTAINIVMAHLTCTGGVLGGGEREAQTIFEYHVSAQTFPADTHYVALGHLHGRQHIPAPCPVHYSGAPLAVDFGEQENTPVVCLVDVTPTTPARVTDIPITAAKRLRTVTGTVAELTDAAREYGDDYLRVFVREAARSGLRDEIVALLPNALEVRIHPEFMTTPDGATRRDTTSAPRELFADYCAGVALDDPAVAALFDELLDETVKD